MPETKAISNAMAILFFILMKFDLQSNGFFPELLPSLQNFLLNAECLASQVPRQLNN